MNKNILLLVFLCMAAGKLSAHFRELIIFLDFKQFETHLAALEQPAPFLTDDESLAPALGANCFAFLPAVYQKKAPILVSTSVLKNILKHKETYTDFITLDISELEAKYQHRVRFSSEKLLSGFRRHCLYAHRMVEKVLSLLRNIICEGTDDEVARAFELLTTQSSFSEEQAPRTLQFYNKPSKLRESMHKEVATYVLCAFAPLDDYHVKRLTKDLTLLIPKEYAKSCTYKSVLYSTDSVALTPAEKAIGLKVNHLPDVTNLSVLTEDLPIPQSFTFVRHLKRLFVTKDQTDSPHEWIIYLAGHGLPPYEERQLLEQLKVLKMTCEKELITSKNSAEIAAKLSLCEQWIAAAASKLNKHNGSFEELLCGMPPEEFTATLLFFNSQVTTHLLSYISCFAGGNNLIKPFKKDKKDLIFNYDIIAVGTSDAPVWQSAPMLLIPPYSYTKNGARMKYGFRKEFINPQKRSLRLYTTTHFDEFFNAVHHKGPKDYYRLACRLHPYEDPDSGELLYVDNIAHVRKAGKTSFEPLLPACIPLIKTDNTAIMPSEAQAYCVTAHKVSSITLDSEQKPPAFVSLIPAAAWHSIGFYEAPECRFFEVVESFMQMKELATPKLFHIKKLYCRNSIDLPEKKGLYRVTLTDVIIAQNVYTSENLTHNVNTCVYFTDSKGRSWHIPLGGRESEITAEPINFSQVKKELRVIFNLPENL